MTNTPTPRPVTPVLQIVSLAADSLHVLGWIMFIDPDLDEPRQYNIEATAAAGRLHVSPAGSQSHLPNGDTYLAEATRLATALLRATFPHFIKTTGQ